MIEHKPTHQLVRYFGLGTGIILIISSIIGSGVYKKTAAMAAACWSPEMILLAWVLAGVITLLGVLSMAEIAMLMPESGGSFLYLTEIYGKGCGYSYGWASFVCIQSASAAAIACVCAQSLNTIVPLPRLGGAWESTTLIWMFQPYKDIGVKLVAVGLIALLTVINYRGVQAGGRLNNVITVTVVVSLFAMILFGFAARDGDVSHWAEDATVPPPADMPNWIVVLFSTMLASFWAYEGWINIGFVGDEIKHPERNIPRILIYGMLLIMAIYVLLNMAYLYNLSVDDILRGTDGRPGYLARDDQGNFVRDEHGHYTFNDNYVVATEVTRKLLGGRGALIISLLIVLTTAGCTNSTILTSGRIYYAMAKKGLFFPAAAVVHPRFKVPGNSLVIFAIWSCVLVFSGSFEQLTDRLVFAQFIYYGLVVAGVFVLRKRLPDAHRPYKVFGYPWVPGLFLLFCSGLLVNTLLTKPEDAVFSLILIALGAPFYWLFKRAQVATESPTLR